MQDSSLTVCQHQKASCINVPVIPSEVNSIKSFVGLQTCRNDLRVFFIKIVEAKIKMLKSSVGLQTFWDGLGNYKTGLISQ